MERPIVFQGLVIWHPTEKQIKDDDSGSAIIVEPKYILAVTSEAANMELALMIPEQYRKQLKQIQLVVRPF